MVEAKKVENFFDVNVKASDELEKAVAEELKKEDPSAEQAKALLESDDNDKSEGT